MDPRVYSRRLRASSWTLVPRSGGSCPVRNRCGAPRRWIQMQLQEVDVPVVCRALEAADLGGAELRGLVQHDAGGLVAVGAAVFGERVAEQLAGVGLGQVGPAVGLGDFRGAAADDDAVAALVEDLGDGGVEFLAVSRPVEADADIAGREVGVAARYPPGCAAGLVVQRDVQVPCPGGLVLERPREVTSLRRCLPRFPGA